MNKKKIVIWRLLEPDKQLKQRLKNRSKRREKGVIEKNRIRKKKKSRAKTLERFKDLQLIHVNQCRPKTKQTVLSHKKSDLNETL